MIVTSQLDSLYLLGRLDFYIPSKSKLHANIFNLELAASAYKQKNLWKFCDHVNKLVHRLILLKIKLVRVKIVNCLVNYNFIIH